MDANEMVRILRSNADVNPHAAAMTMAADLIESLQAKLAAEKRMVDAAVRDMRRDSHCLQCKKHRSVGGDCLGFSMCGKDRPGWKWRGPCAENANPSEIPTP